MGNSVSNFTAMKIKRLSERKYRIDVAIEHNGKQYRKRETYEGTERGARERWHELRHDLKDRACSDEQKATERVGTFWYIIDQYKADRERVGRCESMGYVFAKLIKDCGHYPVKLITDMFAGHGGYIDQLNKEQVKKTERKLSNATKNRLIQIAKAACKWAYNTDLVDVHHLKNVKLFNEIPRNRVLTDTEITNLRNAIMSDANYLLPAFDFSLKNPIRIDDLRNLTHNDLDLFNGVISYISGKTKTATTAIIYPEMRQYFETIPADCPWLFYRTEGGTKRNPEIKYFPIGDIKKAWSNAKVKAKIPPASLKWHDLRHCAATWLMKQPGIKTYHVQHIGGWKTRAMVERYHAADSMDSGLEAKDILLGKVEKKEAEKMG